MRQYNLNWLNYGDLSWKRSLKQELAACGITDFGVAYMAPKADYYVFRAENIPNAAANILKQEFLSCGAEVAVHGQVVVGKAPESSVIMMGTARQYAKICEKLKKQQFGLPQLAEDLKTAIHNINIEHWEVPFGMHRGYDGCLKLGGKTLVMGIINLTPDSFSDGGSYADPDHAVDRVLAMLDGGAEIIDIGGESTRPGYQPVSAEEEIRRVCTVIEKLRVLTDVPISIDTYKAEVAAAALAAGADIINDVYGLQKDPQMAAVAAEYGCPVIAMHNQENTVYGDKLAYASNLQISGSMIGDMLAYFRRSEELALAAGCGREQLIWDIGFGFGKTPEQNMEALLRQAAFKVLGRPLLLGTSRKSTLGLILDKPPQERLMGTVATNVAGIMSGAQIIRVHDVEEVYEAAKIADCIHWPELVPEFIKE